MLFCDGQSFRFHRHTISKKQVNEAQKTSYFQKQHRQQEINAAKYTKRERERERKKRHCVNKKTEMIITINVIQMP